MRHIASAVVQRTHMPLSEDGVNEQQARGMARQTHEAETKSGTLSGGA